MAKVRITKQFGFETAHALWNYDGKCRHIHGHSYKLFITLIGKPISDKDSTKFGMVMDFGDLKKIINDEIIEQFDHSLLLYKETAWIDDILKQNLYDHVIALDYQPTCENMVIDFSVRIAKHLPAGVDLFTVKLYETTTSFAEWCASDNES